MARDLREQEKEFVAGLSGSTGRDLDGWMQAVAASGHVARNDIIDWLRQQGFAFSNASWLERIHHNGGRLIYGDDDGRTAPLQSAPPFAETLAPSVRQPARTADGEPPPVLATAAATARRAKADVPAENEAAVIDAKPAMAQPAAALAFAAEDTGDLTALLMAAKGLRPLAELVLREIEALVPGTARQAVAPYIQLNAPMTFAALHPAAKELRLYGNFGPHTRDRARKVEAGRGPAPFPDVLILNDARLVDERFRELVTFAYTRALT